MLPDLAKLTDRWNVQEIIASIDNTQWVSVLPPDPTRWSILFIGSQLGSNFTTTPDPTNLTIGLGLSNNLDRERLLYSDFGLLVQLEWFAASRGGAETLSIFYSTIRNPKGFTPPE